MKFCQLFLSSIFLLSFSIFAQKLAPISPQKPAPITTQEQKTAKESESKTFGPAIKDLGNKDPKIRHRGLIVLNSYNTPYAVRASVAMLGDANSEVRKAAIVNVSEKKRLVAFNTDSRILFPLFVDPDIHVRRLACSQLLDIAFFNPPNLDAKTMGIIDQAIKDPDRFIRKSFIKNFSRIRLYYPKANILECFQHQDSEVVDYAAFNLGPMLNTQQAQAASLPVAKIANTKAKIFFLQNSRSRDASAFMQDKNPEVFALAACIHPQSRRGNVLQSSKVQSILTKNALSKKSLDFIFSHMSRNSKFQKFLYSLLQSPQESLRLQALKYSIKRRILTSADFIKVFSDSSQKLRQTLCQKQYARNLNKTETKDLLSIENREAGMMTAWCIFLSNEFGKGDEFLYELLLHSSEEVRLAALETAYRAKHPKRYSLLERSLQETSPYLREQILNLLLQDNSSEAQTIIMKALD